MSAVTTRALLDCDAAAAGREMYALMKELFPICRSITGDGVRQTHDALRRLVPLVTHEVPSGTSAFDWTVPPEWNIRDAWIKGPDGRKVVDFRNCNLHVVMYSLPVHASMDLAELKSHLHSLPELPDVIPYVTSYYREAWGFCLAHHQLQTLEDGTYEVHIDSTLAPGALTYSELVLPGETDDEILISTYTCHPSMGNDNLSGVVLAATLARHLQSVPRRHTFRFLFIPETIGSIVWLSRNEDRVARIKHGLIATCCGDAGAPTYKKSRRGDADVDRAVIHVLKHSGAPYHILDFNPSGSDERQFCSPGFNLPVGSLMRSMYLRYPAYHTSADNLDLMSEEALSDSFSKYLRVLYVLENDGRYVSTNPKCEPQLGKRGLYSLIGARREDAVDEMSLLWLLNLADGANTLLDVAEKSGMDFSTIRRAADALLAHGLLVSLERPATPARQQGREGAGVSGEAGGRIRRR